MDFAHDRMQRMLVFQIETSLGHFFVLSIAPRKMGKFENGFRATLRNLVCEFCLFNIQKGRGNCDMWVASNFARFSRTGLSYKYNVPGVFFFNRSFCCKVRAWNEMTSRVATVYTT